jgi:hypothetical protein
MAFFVQVLWLTCFYTWEVYGGLKPTLQAIMGHGVEAYVVFGDTDNDRYVFPRCSPSCLQRRPVPLL